MRRGDAVLADAGSLRSRIDALERDVVRARKAFQSPMIADPLRERVRARFDVLLDKQSLALATLRRSLDESVGEPGSGAWHALRKIRLDCDRLFSECLGFLAGVLVRSAEVDEGTCAVADALLNKLQERTGIGWSRVTILGDETLFDRVAGIIRLRFPEFSVWGLPASTHEFGHVVARELRTASVLEDDIATRPIQDIVDAEGGGSIEGHLHELFADMFATYVHGPAFLCRSVLLSLDPARAWEHGKTHPMPAMRVHVMRMTLERMDGGDFKDVSTRIGETWSAALASVGEPTELEDRLDEPTRVRLEQWLEKFFGLLGSELPKKARYGTWDHARQLWLGLEAAHDSQNLLADLRPREGSEVPDVLNAAWLYRLGHAYGPNARLAELEVEARKWCIKMVNLDE
jgi:hypothetical protein